MLPTLLEPAVPPAPAGAARGKLSMITLLGGTELDPCDVEYGPLVGKGVTAEVFEGSWGGRQIAIKRFPNDITKMPDKMFRDLLRELAILQSVRHENLLHMIGVLPYEPVEIVTEFCAGGSCFDLIHNAVDIEPAWHQKVKICMDTAAGLRYLHSLQPPILHRDLKSLNMLLADPLTDDVVVPRVKVCDFGLSRLKDDEDQLTMGVGTVRWQAPEVLARGQYDEKVDVYSFAMIMFEAICLEMPFEDEEDHLTIIKRVCAGGRPDLDAVPPTCPDELSRLMIECWDQDAAKRPCFEGIYARLAACPKP